MSDLNKHREKDRSVATGAGAAGGGAAGAAAGMAVGGPVGSVIGAAIGAVSGGFLGHEASEATDPEDIYWRKNYSTKSYVKDGEDYSVYRPAYAYGWSARRAAAKGTFEEMEQDLKKGWNRFEDKVELKWDRAKDAIRDGWHRVERSLPGDFDNDGR